LEVKIALLAVNEVLTRHDVEEVKTVSSTLLALQCELEESYGLSYFDSLLAASALAVDRHIVSDDEAFDRVPELKRTPLSSRQ
jgi:predicted nucleic acid-binding protein